MSDTNQLTIETYEKHAQTYIDTLPPQPSKTVLEWIDYNLAHLTPESKILEIGSGPGRDADYIESKGFRVERTDAADSFVRMLQEQGHDARKLNIITDALTPGYDMIFADAVLLHLTKDETLQVIAKIYAALKPNGRFVFNLKRGDFDETTTRKLNAPRYYCYWKPDDIEALLFNLGFMAVNDKITADERGEDRPAWLRLTAVKGNEG